MCRKQPGIGTWISVLCCAATLPHCAGCPPPAPVHSHRTRPTLCDRLATRAAAVGRLCSKCDGKCVICDSYVRPTTAVRICDECNYGSYAGRCVVCGGAGVADAYYCKECTQQEKDRDGCPKIINIGAARTDMYYEKKKYGFKK
jgi:PHD finger-like domain-containing protein 5A